VWLNILLLATKLAHYLEKKIPPMGIGGINNYDYFSISKY